MTLVFFSFGLMTTYRRGTMQRALIKEAIMAMTMITPSWENI